MSTKFSRLARRILPALIAGLLTMACGSDGKSSGPGPLPTIAVAVNPATLTVPQGGTGTVAVGVTRGGGFAGTVSLATNGLPAGVSATVTPDQVSGTTTNATVTVTVAANVAPGTYTAAVNANATGVIEATAAYTLTVTATPSFQIAATPTAVTVGQGATGTAAIAITRTNFTAAVNLTAEVPTAGISATFTPASSTTNASSLQVAVNALVTPGNYPVTVRANATGMPERTTQVMVTVTSVGYSISPAPGTITLQQGSSGTVNIGILRTNFTGVVTLTLPNATPGVTATFAPSSTAGGTSTLTLAVAATTAPGTYYLMLTGTAAGTNDRVAQLVLTVTPPIVGGNTEWKFCSTSEIPTFFAYQDGAGAWTRVQPAVLNGVTTYTFPLSQATGAVAYVVSRNAGLTSADASSVASRNRVSKARALVSRQQSAARRGNRATFARTSLATVYETEVTYGTRAELQMLGNDNCAATTRGKTVTASVSGLSAAGQMGMLSLGGASEYLIGGPNATQVQFDGVRPGVVDFVGARSTNGVPDKLLVRRNLNIADGGAMTPAIDFAAASAPAAATATVVNASGEQLMLGSMFLTANGEAGTLFNDSSPSTNAVRPWAGVPASQLVAGDIHALMLFATPEESGDEMRFLLQYVNGMNNETLTLGPAMWTPTVAVAAGGAYPRLRISGGLFAEYRNAAQINIGAENGSGNSMFIIVTEGYMAAVGTSRNYDVTTPDLAALAGFPVAARLSAGSNMVVVTGYGWTGAGILAPRPKAGDVLRAGSVSLSINVP